MPNARPKGRCFASNNMEKLQKLQSFQAREELSGTIDTHAMDLGRR